MASPARGPLRGQQARTWRTLEGLKSSAVVVDANGDAWQAGGIGPHTMYWYRAYDADGISSYELAQRAKTVIVIDEGRIRTEQGADQ